MGLSAYGEEVGWDIVCVSPDIVVCSHNPGSHIINTPLRDSAVQDRNGQVGAPVCCASLEKNVTWHGHVQTSQGITDTGMVGLPITHDETLEVQLILQKVVHGVRVGAAVGVARPSQHRHKSMR